MHKNKKMTTEEHALDESKLIALLHDPQKQREAFSAVVMKYSEQLYWQIRRMVLTHEDADDLLQNTFIKAWSNIHNFRGDSQLSTWLYRIAINETLTYLNQKRAETVPLDSTEGIAAEHIESDIYFNGSHADALLQEAISKLPDKQRMVFNMKYFNDMKYEEISEILGTSVGALKASYHIAVKKIESYLRNSININSF